MKTGSSPHLIESESSAFASTMVDQASHAPPPIFVPLSSFYDPPVSSESMQTRKVVDATVSIANIEDLENANALEQFMYTIMADAQTKANQRAIADFQEELFDWEKRFNRDLNRIKDLHRYQDSIYDTLKYLWKNNSTFLIFLKNTLSATDYALILDFINDEYDSFKLLEPVLPVVLAPITIFLIKNYSQELNSITYRYQSLLSQSPYEKNKVDILHKQLYKERRETLKNSGFKLSELMCYQVFPILIITFLKNRFEYKQIIKLFRLIFSTIKKIGGIKGLIQASTNEKKWTENLKPSISITPKFTKDFEVYIATQSECADGKAEEKYFIQTGLRAFSEQPVINALLTNQQAEFTQKVNVLVSELDGLIQTSCTEEHFTTFKNELKKQGYFFSGLENSPESFEEWINKKDDVAWKRKLCEKTVEHHLTIGRLLKNGNTTSLLSKIGVEKQFVIFNMAKNVIDIASNILQLILFLPKSYFILARECLSQIEKRVPLPGLELSFILYPDINLSVDGIAGSIVAHFFGYYHKPNEYSLKGYWIELQKKWNYFIYNLEYTLFILMKWSFQISDKLLQFCLRTKNSPAVEAPAYIKINKILDSNQADYRNVMDQLERKLQGLRLLDIKHTLNGQATRWGKGIANEEPIDEENAYDWCHLQSMITGLTEGNFSLFPQDVLDHFKFEVNIELNEDNKKYLRKQFEECYTSSMKDFFQTSVERT